MCENSWSAGDWLSDSPNLPWRDYNQWGIALTKMGLLSWIISSGWAPLLLFCDQQFAWTQHSTGSVIGDFRSCDDRNKPAAQAAGTDPSWCNFTYRRSLPHPAKSLYLLNQWCNFDVLRDLERSFLVRNSLFYNWKRYLKPFGRGSAVGVKLSEKKDD